MMAFAFSGVAMLIIGILGLTHSMDISFGASIALTVVGGVLVLGAIFGQKNTKKNLGRHPV